MRLHACTPQEYTQDLKAKVSSAGRIPTTGCPDLPF